MKTRIGGRYSSSSPGQLFLGNSGSRRVVDKTGFRHGYLTVIGFHEMRETESGTTKAAWVCRCDCGNEVVLMTQFLRKNGGTKSCGCKVGVKRSLKFAAMMLKIFKRQHTKTQWRRKYAKDRPFSLTVEDVERLIFDRCHYCGAEPSGTMQHYDGYRWNGIDRVDNSKGYEVSNCVTACKSCNFAKNKMAVSDFLSWLERIAKHQLALGNISLVSEADNAPPESLNRSIASLACVKAASVAAM